MSSFDIKVNKARLQADNMGKYVTNIGEAISAVEDIKRCLEAKQVYTKLQNVINDLYDEKEKMDQLQGALNDIIEKYIYTENKILNNKQERNKNNISLTKDILKALFDIGAKGGKIGKSFSIFSELFKVIVDGDEISIKDIGKIIKGAGYSAVGISELMDAVKKSEWQKMIGLDKFKTIKLNADSEAGWLTRLKMNAPDTFISTLKDQLNPIKEKTDAVTGATIKKLDGAKVAGWAFTLVSNGFGNYEEYQKSITDSNIEDMSMGRAVAETISETLIDIGKTAAITAGIAAGIATIGVSAPAVVVAGAGVVVSAGLDWVCKNMLTGESFTETVSDGILDLATAAGEKITGAISNVGDAIGGWWNKIQLAW